MRLPTPKERQVLVVFHSLLAAGLSKQEAADGATERGRLMDYSRLEELLAASL